MEAWMRPTWLGCLILLALAAAGCGEQKPALAAVRGHVYFRGAPLAGGAIVFTPDPERGGRGPLACARIDGDGGFVLVTGQDFGAVPGWHRVTFTAPARDGPSASPETMLPARFSDPEQSKQSGEVKAGQSNVVDFHLE
jgi:hypothetical protein